MAAKRVIKRPNPSSSAGESLLDAFFHAFSVIDRRALVSAICTGVNTGAALSDVLGWGRDKASRQIRVLAAGGVVETRRDAQWLRVKPQLAGVDAALAWARELRTQEPSSPPKRATSQERLQRAKLLSKQSRRGLLTRMGAQPEANQAELARACGLRQPVASRALARLVNGGLASVRRESGLARHTVRAEAIEGLWAWL